MDNQLPSPQMDQPVTAALQSLQDMEQNNLKTSELKRKQLMQNFENTPLNQAAISQAMAILGDNSTAGQVGKAINSDSGWANLCEAYAEQQIYGHQGVYPTAIAAYQDNANKGNINTSTNIPKGAQAFFNADSGNGYNGHTMVSLENGKLQGPMQDGKIGTFTLDDWLKYSGQKFLGWSK